MKWKKIIRETGLREHICEHGVGHPDYISACIMAAVMINNAGIQLDRDGKTSYGDGESVIKSEITFEDLVKTWLTHGCDGCCSRSDFPGQKIKKEELIKLKEDSI